MVLSSLKNASRNQMALHSIIWVFFIMTSLLQFYETPFTINLMFFVQWVICIFLFYINYFYLVPKMLLQKKYTEYFICILVLVVVCMTIRLHFFVPEMPRGEMPRVPKLFDSTGKPIGVRQFRRAEEPILFKIIPSVFYLLIIAVSASVKTLSEFYSNQQNKLISEAQKINTELIYLRKQTNPHFLFNALNSIYSLAYKKSETVPDAIITLSELMRYMLYETDNKTVLLEKEINYIKNYIALQKLRLNNIENIFLNIHGETKNKFIEPLLLISFIENAFKYGTDYKGTAHVKIRIVIDDTRNVLDFWVENKIEKHETDPENSGIGMTNIKSRLELLYPGAHQLSIVKNGQTYAIHLNLNLDQIRTEI